MLEKPAKLSSLSCLASARLASSLLSALASAAFGCLRASSRLVTRVFFLAACFLFCVIYEIISHTHTHMHTLERRWGAGGGRGVAHTATHNDVGLSWTAARSAHSPG